MDSPSDSKVELIGKSFIKSSDPDHKPYVLPVSVFDLNAGRHYVSVFYAYLRPSSGDAFASVVATVKFSLAQILTFFPPFAGRVVFNPTSHEPEILCNNAGVELTEALADTPLQTLDFYNLDKSLKRTTVDPSRSDILVSLQVTGYACGGFSLAWTFDHLIADGPSFIGFLNLWAELARTKRISAVPNHDRAMFRNWALRNPTRQLESIYKECDVEEILAIPLTSTIKRLYYVDGSCLERLRAAASDGGGTRRTRTEAFSAHLWKILAKSSNDGGACKMAWAVDARPRILCGGASSYVGNLVGLAVAEASVAELNEAPLARMAGIVSKAISGTASEDYFADMAGWMEGRRSSRRPLVPKVMLGTDGPAVMVSSWHNMPVVATDFGFGAPWLGMLYARCEAMGVGFVAMLPSGKGDGSWLVFALVSPRLAAAMESDPDGVFQPATAAHLETKTC